MEMTSSDPLRAGNNLLVVQAGSASCAGNAALSGLIAGALDHEEIGEIYGALGGLRGLLAERFIDLAAESQQNIRALRTTAGAALGTVPHFGPSAEELQRLLEVLKAHDVRHLFVIGGRSAQEDAASIHEHARQCDCDLRVIGLPESIDNDLPVTDHCPGYGSALKYVATTLREVAQDGLAAGIPHLITIVEVSGAHSGWLAAGASLARRRNHPEDAPQLLYLPEVAFARERLLQDVQRVLQSLPHCVIVAAEGIADAEGNPVGPKSGTPDEEPIQSLSTGDVLRAMITAELRVPVRTVKLGAAVAAAAHGASRTDIDEAFAGGRRAVAAALEGASGKMLTLLRNEGPHYEVQYDFTDFAGIVGSEKNFPASWIEADNGTLSPLFGKYALPLIQGSPSLRDDEGLPFLNFLKKIPVTRRLP